MKKTHTHNHDDRHNTNTNKGDAAGGEWRGGGGGARMRLGHCSRAARTPSGARREEAAGAMDRSGAPVEHTTCAHVSVQGGGAQQGASAQPQVPKTPGETWEQAATTEESRTQCE